MGGQDPGWRIGRSDESNGDYPHFWGGVLDQCGGVWGWGWVEFWEGGGGGGGGGGVKGRVYALHGCCRSKFSI